jgi:hypothetical protein
MLKRERNITEVIETLDVHAWDAGVYTDMTGSAVGALEDGKILYFPRLAFVLLPEEQRFLSPGIADTRSKNVSFDPKTGALKHAIGTPADVAAVERMIRRYSGQAYALIRTLLPTYAATLELGRTSFRPAEISGRALSARKDDTRLHVDAFPSTPTGGKRIMRVFTNVNPEGQGRHWRIGAHFEDVANLFANRIPRHSAALARLLSAMGVTKSYRTAYDHMMLKMHDTMKTNEAYQREVEQAEFSFPAGSTWIVYTDKVSHAAMGGQHLFEQTFYVPVQAMADPSKAPLRILERLAARALV